MTDMENKNTFPFKTTIITNKETLTPCVGDELVFCRNERVAVASYLNYVDEVRSPEYEPIEAVYLTDIFNTKDVSGTLCHPVSIGLKKFGFVGCRTRLSNEITQGHFFLYETE